MAVPKTTSADVADDVAVPRICVCGAGIAGLTFAGIISKTLGDRVHITVLERAPADYDQGYGLDLDRHGQEALVRAGVYHRYWEISHPLSDSYKLMPTKGSEPLAIFHRPCLLQSLFPSWFGARPESNRGKLRDILLEAMADRKNVDIQFDSPIWEIREVKHENGSTAEILNKSGSMIGEYDLVVDAMGLHSTMRHHRVEDQEGKHYSGQMLIHGVIDNPEDTFPPELMERFGSFGTMIVVAKGYRFVIQRFGAGPADNRTAWFYGFPREGGEDGIFEEIGIPKPTSRKSGIISDEERLDKIKAWVVRDMGEHFDPLYHQLVNCVDRITVRGNYSHGDSTLREDITLPLVCIGDSLLNCGLGGGGILAMQDAIELSTLLEKDNPFDMVSGRVNTKLLRSGEQVMMSRKVEHLEKKNSLIPKMLQVRDGKDPNPSLSDFVKNRFLRALARISMYMLTGLFKRWYQWDQWRGQAGSVATSPIYPNVKKALM